MDWCKCNYFKRCKNWRGGVVGAGSVVTHDIPANSIAHGNPAEVTRMIEE